MTPYRLEAEAILLTVRVTARAGRSEAAGVIDTGDGRCALAVRLAAPPVDGAANRALIDFLAAMLAIPRSAIAIVSGETSRLKRVRLTGATPEDVERWLAGL